MTNIGAAARPEHVWPELLQTLDRQVGWASPSADTATLADLMSVYRVPGVSIAVVHGDGPVWATGYGTTSSEAGTPVTPHTIFQACSISKHVAAFGALRLVGDGVLDLDADIDEYLTSWHLPASAGWRPSVTVRQLLAHTAGLSNNWFRGYGPGDPVPSMLQTLRGEAPANTPPVRPALLPGSQFRYSGSHYAVLQQLVEDLTATRFDEVMNALVLQPLAMTDSSYDQGFPHGRMNAVAKGHHRDGTPVLGGWRTIPEMAGAGLWTTPTDLLKLEREIDRAACGESSLINQGLAASMLTPQVPGGYGLGTEVSEKPGHRRFGHSGDNVGYTCFSYAWPDADAAVAVMMNADGTHEVLSSVLAAAERQYQTGNQTSSPDHRTGRYVLRGDYVIDIAEEHGELTLTAPGQSPAILQRMPGGSYRHQRLDLEVSFHDADGQSYITMRQGGAEQTVTLTR